MEKPLGVPEVAEELNYSERWVRDMLKRGVIIGTRLKGLRGKWLITRENLDNYKAKHNLLSRSIQENIPDQSLPHLGRDLKDPIKEAMTRKPEPPPQDNDVALTVSERQAEILSKLFKHLDDIKDIATDMTGSAGYGEKKEDYREPFQKSLNLAREVFVSGRVFLLAEFVVAVNAFFRKIDEMNIEFETAISEYTPNGPERAQSWEKAGIIAHQEIPKLLDVIENQARIMIAEKVNPANTRPSIEVTPQRNSNDYSIEVKNNGNVADFEAQIEIIKDGTGYNRGKLYLGYWKFGQGPKSTFGNIDRIKIAHLETMVPPRGAQAIAPFFMTLQLYYSEKSGTASPSSWNSTSWTISENNAILKPEYILKVTISSNPPLTSGKFIKEYKLDFEGLAEITPS